MQELKSYKLRFCTTVALIAISLGAIGFFVGIVDPYQQYGAHEMYLGNQRMEIAGVAKHHDYNAIITGSLMAMNHYTGQADSLWGWKTKNFTLLGARYDDYEIVLPYVLSHGKAKNVIMGLDMFSFSNGRYAINPYLYDNSNWNNYEYHWNYSSLKDTYKILRSPQSEQTLYHFSSAVGKDVLIKSFQNTVLGYPDEEYDFDLMKERFDNTFIPILENTSDEVKWLIYFPPYSIAEFIIYDKTGVFDANMNFKKYMISRLSNFKNVELFDFQCAPWITNLEEYMDVRHHSHEYNRRILMALHEGEYRADSEGHVDDIRQFIIQYADSLKL